MHPAVRVDRPRAVLLGLVPVAEHHRVAAGAQLAGLAARHGLRRSPGRRSCTSTCGCTRPTVADPLARASSSTRRLRRHRRGLGHAVADRHLVHVHVADAPLHHLDRARRAGHDPGAQGRQVELREVGQLELGDEHRRHAVERRAALVLHRLAASPTGSNAARRDDHRGAVRGAGEVAEHHAEAVVEGHRDADAVVLGVAAPLADEEAVVEDVVVRERRALREAGRARSCTGC